MLIKQTLASTRREKEGNGRRRKKGEVDIVTDGKKYRNCFKKSLKDLCDIETHDEVEG